MHRLKLITGCLPRVTRDERRRIVGRRLKRACFGDRCANPHFDGVAVPLLVPLPTRVGLHLPAVQKRKKRIHMETAALRDLGGTVLGDVIVILVT